MASLAMALHQDNWIQRYLAPDLPGCVKNYLWKSPTVVGWENRNDKIHLREDSLHNSWVLRNRLCSKACLRSAWRELPWRRLCGRFSRQLWRRWIPRRQWQLPRWSAAGIL